MHALRAFLEYGEYLGYCVVAADGIEGVHPILEARHVAGNLNYILCGGDMLRGQRVYISGFVNWAMAQSMRLTPRDLATKVVKSMVKPTA